MTEYFLRQTQRIYSFIDKIVSCFFTKFSDVRLPKANNRKIKDCDSNYWLLWRVTLELWFVQDFLAINMKFNTIYKPQEVSQSLFVIMAY